MPQGDSAESALLGGAAPPGDADGIRHTERAPRPLSKLLSGFLDILANSCIPLASASNAINSVALYHRMVKHKGK